MLYVVCINLHKVSYKSNLHCRAWWCFINQRHILLEFDNFRIVDLGVRNHSNKKGSFELQSFAIFGFQSLDHILSFFLKIFLIKNFGFLFPFFTLNWKRLSNRGIPPLTQFFNNKCDNYVPQWWVEFDDDLSWLFTKRFRVFYLICRK